MSFFFFFNDTATTEIYTLSLHDALPISGPSVCSARGDREGAAPRRGLSHAGHRGLEPRPEQPRSPPGAAPLHRSEEHTSELQSRQYLVCRLLLEKKQSQTEMVCVIDRVQ